MYYYFIRNNSQTVCKSDILWYNIYGYPLNTPGGGTHEQRKSTGDGSQGSESRYTDRRTDADRVGQQLAGLCHEGTRAPLL